MAIKYSLFHKIERTTKLLGGASQDIEHWLELSNQTFSGVVNIGEVFEIANDDERRKIMVFLGSNWFLHNKKVELTPRKPLNLLHVSTRNPDWRAVAEQVWNYFSENSYMLRVP